jgi:hypothetical protein
MSLDILRESTVNNMELRLAYKPPHHIVARLRVVLGVSNRILLMMQFHLTDRISTLIRL